MMEIYPQLVIGGVQTVPKDTWAQFYPTLVEICGPSSLLTDLQALRTKGTLLEGLKDAARQAITSRGLATDGRQLARDYPEIERIAALLDAGRLDEAVTAIADCGDLSEKSIQLGDSMLANLVLSENQLVVETAHRFLKVLWFIKILSKGWMIKLLCKEGEAYEKPPSEYEKPPSEYEKSPSEYSRQRSHYEGRSYIDFVKRFWTAGAVSIPLDIPAPKQGAWPTQGYLEQKMEKPAPSDSQNLQSLSNELKILDATRTDLEQQYQAQLTKQKAGKLSKEQFVSQRAREDDAAARTVLTAPADSTARTTPTTAAPIDWNTEFEKYAAAINPNLLTDEFYQRLSAATRTALTTIGFEGANIDVPAALGAIDRRAAALHSTAHRPRASVPAFQFGSLIVEASPSVLSEIICGEPEKQCHCELLKQLALKHGEKPQVRILGTGRAYRVRQELKGYERGELVHTEPVLGRTKRNASFRELNRVEEVQETITSRETFEEKETTTHDQFEFATEVARQTEQDHQEQAGVSVTASYGPVSMSGSYSTSSATAASDAAHTASNSAKEVINKALKRIQVKEQKRLSITRITETERKNGFEINNEGNPSFTGFYYAINKKYENHLIEVGERLMIRVAIQQPMAFLLHCMATLRPETVTLEKPIPPAELNDHLLGSLNSFQDITGSNYAAWASLYDAQGVKPPPTDVVVSHAVNRDWPSNQWVATSISIDVPTGYEAVSALVTCLYSPGSGHYIDAFLGHAYFSQNGGSLVLDKEQTKIWGTIRGHVEEYAINYVITCAPTSAEINKWKIETYNAVMDGYRKKKADYDGQISVAGIALEGRNPLKNKMLIEQELQKFVLGALYPPFYYRGFDSMKFGYKCDVKGVPEAGSLPIPEPDFKDANEELPWVTFFLQLFEFKNMIYQFLPYDLGNRSSWCVLRRLEDVDPFFENAISAGYVVVDIPVAPQMTKAFLHFYQTQEIWNGGDMPLYGDPMFQEIAIAIKNSENLGDGEAIGEPWTTTVPTSLVYVQDGVPADL